jgi:formyltetrahydrofolate-dependent phosphoribosylglycinamide formyltransferase
LRTPSTHLPLSAGTPRLVVLISGSGNNLQALIDATSSRELDASIALVVANRKAAYGLERAAQAGIETLYFPLKPYTDAGRSRADYDADLAARVAAYTPDLIVLAGWMHILSTAFLDRFPGQVVNLHPALPGTFPGTDAIRRAFDACQRGEISGSGCMVHYAVPQVDAGAVIAQAVVPYQPGDTLAAFEARMHEAEHRLIVEGVQRALLAPPIHNHSQPSA